MQPKKTIKTTFDKQLLAIVDLLEPFRRERTGCRFKILTDYKPLVSFPTHYNLTEKQCR